MSTVNSIMTTALNPVMTVLADIQKQQTKMLALLEERPTSIAQLSDDVDFDTFHLPISSNEQMELLSAMLSEKENRKKLVSFNFSLLIALTVTLGNQWYHFCPNNCKKRCVCYRTDNCVIVSQKSLYFKSSLCIHITIIYKL